RTALVLLRADGDESFGAGHVAFARQCASISLAALVARMGGQLEAEVLRLSEQVVKLQHSEEEARHNSALMKEIVDQLPIALTVQDDAGRFVFVNSAAATNLDTPAEALVGVSPGNFLSPDDAAGRREWEIGLMQSGRVNVAE